MKHLFLSVFAILILALVDFGQATTRTRLIKVPREVGVAATVEQPDCPLKIIQTELLTKEDGAYPIVRYVIQNTSPKPIRYFSVAFAEKFTIRSWHRFGSGTEDGVGREDGKGPVVLREGSQYSNWEKTEFEYVSTNEAVQKLFESMPDEPQLKFIGLGMVTKIIFADGSKFDSEAQYKNLYELFMGLD